MTELIRTTWLIFRKDILTEFRTREVMATMGLFSLLVVVVFAFAFSVDESKTRLVTPGIVWVVLLFSATLGLHRVFDREREHRCLLALCLAPGGPHAVYVAKALGIFVFAALTQLLTVPLIFVFLSVEIATEAIPLFLLAMALGTLGISLVGTLFGGMFANVRMRELLLPMVVYPIVVPVIIAGVELTQIALGGGLPEQANGWIQLMVGFDLIFSVIPAWVFGRVMLD